MSIDVKIPPIGESITSGVLGSWKRKNGDTVSSGDPLFEIETDKVTSEVFAETDGTLEILVPEGTEVKVGQTVGHLHLGELAVWVGVTAEHRGAAFDACRYIIDEAKARVPIWKKEHYADGDTAWINCATRGDHAAAVKS